MKWELCEPQLSDFDQGHHLVMMTACAFENSLPPTRWCPSLLAKLVKITSISLWLMVDSCYIYTYVVYKPGRWLTYPSEIYEFVNWDDDIPN